MPLHLSTIGFCARRIVRILVGMYYAPVRITGCKRQPDAPILYVANHQDSLLDPVLVGTVARRNVRFLAKATLFDVPVVGTILRGLGMIPAYRPQDDPTQVRRNLEILDLAAQALADGSSVGIFPEGKSHDLPRIEQIKSGTARIAQKAVELGGNPLLVAIGMNFERKEGFRTALWIQVGEPLKIRELLSAHPHEKQAQRALTVEIESRLKQVALHLDDVQLLPLLEQLEHLVPHAGFKSPGPLGRLQMRKRIADALNHFYATDRPRAEAAAATVHAYAAELNAAGVRPDSPVMRFRRWRLTFRLLRDALLFCFGLIPALAGFLHHCVPYFLSRRLAMRFNDGKSTLALVRLATGLPLMLLTYVGVWFALRSHFLPWVAWAWVLAMPYCGFVALKKIRRLRRGGQSLWSQCKLSFGNEKIRVLRNSQEQVRKMVVQMADEYASISPPEPPLEKPWTGKRVRKYALRWALALTVAALVWTAYAHWKRSHAALALGGMELTTISEETLQSMLTGDEAILRQMLPTLESHGAEARKLAAEFASGKRTYYAQADNDELHQMLRRYVTTRTALVRMIWRYQKSDQIKTGPLHTRTFLCACTAGNALAMATLDFVDAFSSSSEAVKKLNEAEPAWEIPAGVFDTVLRSMASTTNRRALELSCEKYDDLNFNKFALHKDFLLFHSTIAQGRKRLASASGLLAGERMKQPLRDARDEGKELIYDMQTLVSTWMGDTKLREPGGPLIAKHQIAEVMPKLQPGDIVLERRNWYVSNAFLPGYWPHAALYIGTPEDLEKLGLRNDSRVSPHWDRYLKNDSAGHRCVIIESISEGVVFTSLEHSIGEADSAALLRPRLAPELIREAIAKAFSHVGKPYDFEFDFFSSDKLVCTELVYRAYDGPIRFTLKDIMGTRTLPAIEFVRKYSAERQHPHAQFEFIFCLQGDAAAKCAHFVDENAFLRTLSLPGNDLLLAAP